MAINMIVRIGGSALGLTYNDGSEITIGREIGNSIASVESEGLSRRHAKIFSKDGKWTIEDLGSTNGTVVNGSKITSPVEIKCGDKISCGKFAFAIEPLPVDGETVVKELPPVEIPTMKSADAGSAPKPVSPIVPVVPAASKPAAPAAAPEKPATPAAPAAPAAKPAAVSPAKPGLRPGLKLPPGKILIKPGLKLPAAKPGLKPGLKLPPKPALKVPPKQ